MSNPVLVVLGAGPGLGLAVARRFGADGYDVALAGLSEESLAPLGVTLREEGIAPTLAAVDLSDPRGVTELVTAIGEEKGRIDVLHFNPSAYREKDPLQLSVEELIADLQVGVTPLLPAVQAARPFMTAGGRILVTGSAAADKPWHGAASLGIQKAAVRNLVTSLDATLKPDGIRAVAVQINGTLAREGAFSPGPVSAALHAAATRPDEGWTAHVAYDG